MSAVLQEGKVATMDQLRRQGAPEANMPMVRMGFDNLQGFELLQRAAKAIASSTLVPQQFQGSLPNCLIAIEMAQRIGASPLMVCQNLYIVHGRPGWSAKFLIASFNQCGRFSAIRYEWVGTRDKDDWGCRAYATEKATGDKINGPLITIALAKKEGWYDKSGSKWKTIPELMLQYRAAAWMVNTHAPEISMGLNTSEELGDVYDARPSSDGTFSVDELRREPLPASDVIDGEPVAGNTLIETAIEGNAADGPYAHVTVTEACNKLKAYTNADDMAEFAGAIPNAIATDHAFTKAYRERTEALKKADK